MQSRAAVYLCGIFYLINDDMLKLKIFFLSVVLLFIGCNEEKPKHIRNDYKISDNIQNRLDLIEYIDDLFYKETIKMETSDEVLVGKIKNFTCDKLNNFLITDNNNSISTCT